MITYPNMAFSSEVKENISLDEDDTSDVEDEVFIRDGKNYYKLAEELNAKRPLMPLRRKIERSNLASKLKTRSSCKILCKTCCYIFATLSILIGIITLVVVLVSIFPLPLNKLRDWILSSSSKIEQSTGPSFKTIPCSNLDTVSIWTKEFPILKTESPIRTIDINQDGVEDIVFGFGSSDIANSLETDTFCSIFFGVSPPCTGGIMALNGSNGEIIWQRWVNDTIHFITCSEDLNKDLKNDCVCVGTKGTLVAIDGQNGNVIWEISAKNNGIYLANFIYDVNNDTIPDILASHTEESESHIIVISGSTGIEIKRITLPKEKSFYMPQLYNNNKNNIILVGTGSTNSPGNLSMVYLENLLSVNTSFHTIYRDEFKGILTQSILVDINGDHIPDIITAMYNSTVLAINGANFEQIWNCTFPRGETNIIPTPGYFNYDNITDFLVIYKLYDNVLKTYYTNTFIIDGKTGKLLLENTVIDSVITQMGGLTLGTNSFGYDMFLYWTYDCQKPIIDKKIDNECKSNPIIKLNAISQCEQPPGFEIYTSLNKSYKMDIGNILGQFENLFQKQNTASNIQQFQPINNNYNIMLNHGKPDRKQEPTNEDYITKKINTGKNIPDYNYATNNIIAGNSLPDYDYIDNADLDFKTNRNPRSKLKSTELKNDQNETSANDDDKDGVYSYKNIQKSKYRLFHDLNNNPTNILLDTYLKNKKSALMKTRFEQRDIKSHLDKIEENLNIKKLLDKERESLKNSYSLWDLESEKEESELSQKGGVRFRRDTDLIFPYMEDISSVGTLVKSINEDNNTIDIVFITILKYRLEVDDIIEKETENCIQRKMSNPLKAYSQMPRNEQRVLYLNECITEPDSIRNENINGLDGQILEQIIVHRLQIKCQCQLLKNDEKCVKFLPTDKQYWRSYLGSKSDGRFKTDK